VKVNLGGVSQSLFESEMFGHKKGAFTDAQSDRMGRFEMADRGSIFLYEIGELGLVSQVKMLRVLQDQTFEPLGEAGEHARDLRHQPQLGSAGCRGDVQGRPLHTGSTS
jgi:two-component system NtrC family response regulator